MQARQGVLFLTAGSDLAGHRNVGKNKRTKYYEADKAYFSASSFSNTVYAILPTSVLGSSFLTSIS